MKTEPEVYSIQDLERDGRTFWDGVRNYLARNHMREMRKGDRILIYHSNASPPGVAGTARVAHTAYPDATAWDPSDGHYDPRSTPERPLWDGVDVAHEETFGRLVPLAEIQDHPRLQGMTLVSGKAMRLSIHKVAPADFRLLVQLGRGKS